MAAIAYGCSPKAPSVQDFCGFLGNPDNCYLRFFEDIGPRCGAIGTPPAGAFLTRDKLDKCILSDGGSVTFDQAPSLDSFPPTSVSFQVTDAVGDKCGSFTFNSTFDFSVTVQSAESEDGGVVKDAGCPVAEDAGDSSLICGGTFTSTNTDGEFVDTTCPDMESHHFISLQLDKEQCADQKAQILKFEIEGEPGGIDLIGHLAVRATYPNGQTVEFFDCEIPAAPKQCCNGVQDGNETGIDCGGPTEPAAVACDRCQKGQGCISSADCLGGVTCKVDGNTGLKACDTTGTPPESICTPPVTTTGSGGGGGGGAGGGGTGGTGGTGGSGGAGGN